MMEVAPWLSDLWINHRCIVSHFRKLAKRADLQGGPGGPWHTLSQAHRGPHPDIRHRQGTGHRPFQLLRLIVLVAGESKQTSIRLFLFLAACAWRLFLAGGGGESATGLAVPGSCSLHGQMYIITTHLSMPFC
jgi:hypothetical protein